MKTRISIAFWLIQHWMRLVLRRNIGRTYTTIHRETYFFSFFNCRHKHFSLSFIWRNFSCLCLWHHQRFECLFSCFPAKSCEKYIRRVQISRSIRGRRERSTSISLSQAVKSDCTTQLATARCTFLTNVFLRILFCFTKFFFFVLVCLFGSEK